MEKREYDEFLKAFDETFFGPWEMGAEGPEATDRGSFKSGFLRGYRIGMRDGRDDIANEVASALICEKCKHPSQHKIACKCEGEVKDWKVVD